MKTFNLLVILLLSLTASAQFPKTVHNRYEPKKVQQDIYYYISTDTNLKSNNKITKDIVFENYKYTYQINKIKTFNSDSILIAWELVHKEKLYYRPFTAMAVTAFGVTMASMISYSSIDIPNDKKLHALAGYYIGISSTALIYKLTKKKWLSIITSELIVITIGSLKEVYDKYNGGTCSNLDAYTTFAGGTTNTLSQTILIH